MGSKAIETATSLERFLNRHVLFVQGIDQNVPKAEVLQVLNLVLKQPQQGRIDILTHPDGKMRGSAFLNFHNEEDARAALDKWRFSLELRGRPLRMQFSSDREYKDVIQGPLVNRFKILIKNLPDDLPPETLFEKFSEYGEIIQVHTASDHYGQHYAIIQYVDVASVQAAIRNGNRERILNNVLAVEPYRPNAQHVMLPRIVNTQGLLPHMQAAPAAAVAAAAAASAAANGGVAALALRSSGGSLPGTTYAALQHQQALEMAEQERNAPYMEEYADDGSVGVPPPPPAAASASPGGPGSATAAAAATAPDSAVADVAASMAVASFFAATTGPKHVSAASGSLTDLLTTALNHVQALEEQLCCPITQEPLVHPVVAADGNTYERLAITAWLAKNDTSPLTNEVLPHKGLTPNNLVRKLVEEIQGIRHSSPEGADREHGREHIAATSDQTSMAGNAAAAAPPPPPAAAAAATPETPVPVPPVSVAVVPMTQPYHGTHHGIPQQQQHNASVHTHTTQATQQQQQHLHHHHHQQQHHHHHHQQYGDFAHMPAVLRPQYVPAPVTFVHVPQPQQFQVQGAPAYAYRPVGM